MKYIIIETQTNGDGTIGILSSSYSNRNEAENKYHTVLAAAAISTILVHCAFMLTDDGALIKSECYRHEEAPNEGQTDGDI